MTTATLSNGFRVLIRPIRPDDKTELQQGLKRLSVETIHKRFLTAKPRFSSAELRYLTEVDGVDHIALVAVELTFPHRIVAVARAIRLPDEPDTAEWAIVVADFLQGKGLGGRLVTLLAAEARAQGIRRFTAVMQSDNQAVARLLARTAPVFERDVRQGSLREVTALLAPEAPLAAAA